MNDLKVILIASMILFGFACQNQNQNKKDKKTEPAKTYNLDTTITFNCFCDTLVMNSKPVVCEPSAILYNNGEVLIASDKEIPNSSSVFKIKYNDNMLETNNIEYVKNKKLEEGKKYEDFTITPDGKYIFLASSFSWLDPNKKETDQFNNLYYWQADKKLNPTLITQNNDTSLRCSKHLTKLFQSILDTVNYPDGVPYLKIEGMASIPGDTLLFAVREYGNSYSDFNYCMKIIAMPYKIKDQNIELAPTAKVIFDYNPDNYKGFKFKHKLGISSIEYNKFDKKLYMLTSYEDGDSTIDVGAYLWSMSLAELKANKAPSLIFNAKKQPIHFAHKAEGLTIVDDKTILVIHDDDRRYGSQNITDPVNQFYRKANQAAYSILRKH